MASNRTGMGIAQVLLALRAHDAQGLSDGQLLRRFLGQRDEAAFAALVRRHGPMVLGVCRRILRNAADAEDAFQATFLVFVRKAAALKGRTVLGDWLHGVARRTALKVKGAATHRWAKEQAMARPEAQGEETRDDWLPLLDEELSGLPEKYRLPIVLCDLEGRTRKEAAEQLGWPEGTVAERLARARSMLAKRLARRGVVVPAGALTVALPADVASACVPPTLVYSTMKAATLVAAGQSAAEGTISAKVALLTGEVMKAMLLSKLKNVAVVLIVCVVGGFGWIAYGSFAKEPALAIQRGDKDKPANTQPPSFKKDSDAEGAVGKDEVDRPKVVERPRATSRELIFNLRANIELKDFQQPMTLKEWLMLIYEKFHTQGMDFPILVDIRAFREENPDAKDVYESVVKFPTYPREMTLAAALKFVISQIPDFKAEALIRDGVIHITTQKHASLGYLIQEKINAGFEGQPLVDVVQTLADITGVSINLDPRIEDKRKTRINATFRNDVTLGGALRIIADMAGLKVVDMQSGLYITTPANAKDLDKELRELRK
jgi:RNA polymerase sigma factor (sigma-70 family)